VIQKVAECQLLKLEDVVGQFAHAILDIRSDESEADIVLVDTFH